MSTFGETLDDSLKPRGSVPHDELVRGIRRLFRPYSLKIIGIVLAVVVSAALGTVNLVLIKVVFDSALFCGSSCPNLTLLNQLVVVMIAVPIVTGTIGVLQAFLANRVGQDVMEDLRNRLYVHLQGMALRFFTGTRSGEIQSRLSNDVSGIQSVVTDTASSILANVVVLVSTLVAMTVISWQLTVISLALVPLFALLTYRAGKARRRVTAATQTAYSEMTAITAETLSVSGILLSKVFGRRYEDVERFRAESRRLADLAVRREMIGRTLYAVIGTFFSAAPAVVFLVAGYLMVGGRANVLSPGTIVAFTALQSRLFFPVGQLLQVSVEVQGSLALFERIFEYLQLSHDIADHPDAVVLDPETARGEVQFDHVYFRYDSVPAGLGTTAATHSGNEDSSRPWTLEDCCFTINPGELVAIVGPSGAGKTTISYLAQRLYDADAGTVRIDGLDVRMMRADSIAAMVGMVTQETYLFHASIRQNLQYARPEANNKDLEDAARSAFIHDRIMQLDKGYDTVVGERGYRMSGGEKQRLAIARVMLRSPRVLILDEATSALDTAGERLVQAALRRLMEGRTTIAIAHRLSTILAAHVILVVDHGRLVERGTHQELLRRNGLYARLYSNEFLREQVEANGTDGTLLANGQVIAPGV